MEQLEQLQLQQHQRKSETSPPSPPHRKVLEKWLNKNMKIKMSDSRTIVGNFLCTDRHLNIILGSSLEYLKDGEYSSEFFIFLLFSNSLSFLSEENEEPRMLGLAMIPGEHIVSIHIDDIRAGKKAKKEKEGEEDEDQEEDDEVMEESTTAAEEA